MHLSPILTKRLILLLAAMALLLPAMLAQTPLRAQTAPVNTSSSPERQRPELGLDGIATPPFRVLEEARRSEVLGQVRITQRVIIRISPSTPDARQRMMSSLPRRENTAAFEEVDHDDCIETAGIAGVTSTRDNRLLFFMRNQDILAAQLERGCTARAFYSGFYVERSEDGRLCVRRDMLQSRAGQSCSLENMTRLVALGS